VWSFVSGLEFGAPWAFWLLVLVPVMVWAAVFRATRAPVAMPSAGRAAGGGRGVRARLRHLPAVLAAAAAVCLIAALARPREGIGQTRTITKGVAIMACVDRSWSMTDRMDFGDRRLSRFEVVKEVFREFVEGNGESLPGREGDLIGIVKFARFADTACPPVQTHSTLLRILADMELAPFSQLEAGTSIGEATALAAARLETVEEFLTGGGGEPVDPDFELTGKVIILLTDGDEKTGRTRALEAAEIAAGWGIRVHAIGIGEPGGRFGFDEATLRGMAERTGGIYRRASSADSLRAVYREIDLLEKTEVRSISSTSYDEFFWWPLACGAALAGASALAGPLLVRRTA
jgi:Ca-activated chloride channel family protein